MRLARTLLLLARFIKGYVSGKLKFESRGLTVVGGLASHAGRTFPLDLFRGGITVRDSAAGPSFGSLISHARPSLRSAQIPYQFKSNSYQARP
jgi:hypothetical protein